MTAAAEHSALQPFQSQTIAGLIAARPGVQSDLLPLLHDIQDALGYIPPDSIALVAQALNLSRAEVHGVVSFYHHFRTEAPGRHVVQVCRAEACKSMGSDALWSHACKHLQLDAATGTHGATTADHSITLQPVYCLGLCSSSPAMALDARVHGRVDNAAFERLVALARSSS
jgi:NADH:ubiquinone oxidoreductase subunit E